MSEITRFFSWDGNEFMHETANGDYVLYEDHIAQVERLTAERHQLRGDVEELTAERDKAHVTIRLLRMSNGACPKLLAEVRANVERLTHERDEARAEVERLKAMLPPTAHTGVRNGPGEGSWSVFAGKVVEERDAARAEIEWLRANGQGMLDGSRRTDEDIWREGFKRQVAEYRKQRWPGGRWPR